MSKDINGNYWLAFRSQCSDTDNAICELFDNSVDAKDSNLDLMVEVTFEAGKKGKFVIRDNAQGCADLEGMFTLGGSDKVSGSGRYGVGSKPSIAYFGTLIEVETVHRGYRQTLTWDTQKDVDTKVWKKGLKISEKELSDLPSGTIITVTKPHTVRNYEGSLGERLGETLAPALSSGEIDLTLNGEKVLPFICTPTGSASVHIKDGCIEGDYYDLEAYVAHKTHPKSRLGLHIHKNHRALPGYLNSREGLHGAQGLYVKVTLHQKDHSKNEWPLDPTSKAFLSNSIQKRKLFAAISRHVEELLPSADQNSRTISLRGMALNFADLVNDRLKAALGGDVDPESGSGTDVASSIEHGTGKGGNFKDKAGDKGCAATKGTGHVPAPGRAPKLEFKPVKNSEELKLNTYSWNKKGRTLEILLREDQTPVGGDRGHYWRMVVALVLWDYYAKNEISYPEGCESLEDFVSFIVGALSKNKALDEMEVKRDTNKGNT